jgi:hypothetical protein
MKGNEKAHTELFEDLKADVNAEEDNENGRAH